MRWWHEAIATVALASVLAGCAPGGMSLGNFSGTEERIYAITGSSTFEEAFMLAHGALQKEQLDIVSLNKEGGELTARRMIIETPYHDVRTIERRLSQVEFALERTESDLLAFRLSANADGWDDAERFLERYARDLEFSEIPRKSLEEPDSNANRTERNLPVISEIRTGNPALDDKKYAFSRQEIIEIQTFLRKLGYDPGPADGRLNRKTLQAIEKFKRENGTIKKLFQIE